MENAAVYLDSQWPWWHKVLFRFACIYSVLYTTFWTWLGSVPPFSLIGEYYGRVENWLVTAANTYIFHVKDVLVPLNGSGDTSYGYAQLCFFLLVAVIGTVIWTIVDKRRNYNSAYYWLIVLIRYYVAMMALSYGIIKLFGLQMVFPSLSALATPLGDLLPMRFSWYFIGYSTPYQFFSGAVEFVAGLLLLFRRTSTLGAFVAASVFLNVMMLNLCYDIPVKLFSIHLFLFSSFLLIADARRLLNFFVFNRSTQPMPHRVLPKRWMRRGKVVLKVVFFISFLAAPLFGSYQRWSASRKTATTPTLATGFFTVEQSQGVAVDSLRWKDVVFETTNMGSILTADTLFRQRYRRAYFSYSFDSLKHTIDFRRSPMDTTALFTMQYTMPDTNHIELRGKIRNDSVVMALRRENRHFQLAERQFHWLSESNR